MIIKCPCKYCDRKGCGSYHDKCEKYKAYKEVKNDIKNQKMKAAKINEAHFDNVRNAKHKNWKDYKKHRC